MRVIVADDALLIREGLGRLLMEAGIEVVGTVGHADELLALVARTNPDVAIVDIRMPPTLTDDGLRAARRIRGEHPTTGVLVLSQYIQITYALELLDNGARHIGYLLKERVADLSELTNALHTVHAGGTALDPHVVQALISRHGSTGRLHALTGRERDVLALMAQGRTNQAIAQHLEITERTVEKHTAGIFGKLELPPSPDDHRRVLAVLAYLNL